MSNGRGSFVMEIRGRKTIAAKAGVATTARLLMIHRGRYATAASADGRQKPLQRNNNNEITFKETATMFATTAVQTDKDKWQSSLHILEQNDRF